MRKGGRKEVANILEIYQKRNNAKRKASSNSPDQSDRLDLALEMLDRNAETPKTLRLFSVGF